MDNGQWTSAREKSNYVTMIKEEAAVQQVIRLEESSVERHRSHIPFAAREAECAFWVGIGGPRGIEGQAH